MTLLSDYRVFWRSGFGVAKPPKRVQFEQPSSQKSRFLRYEQSAAESEVKCLKNRLLSAFVVLLLSLTVTGCGGGASGSESTPVSSAISSVSLMCTPSTLSTNATSQCTAAVQGTGSYSSVVTWSASGGTINASGLFTAPASAGTVTVTATSTQDPTKSGTAAIAVQLAPPTITSVSVSCSPTTVIVSATSQCNATVQGTGSYSSAVTWTASGGTISPSGHFTAPALVGTVTVTATSVQDTTKLGKAAIAVQLTSPTITSVLVTCSPATVDVTATSQCSAAVQGTGSYSSTVMWSASGGMINSSGLFTAPASAGTVTVTATSTQDTTKAGTAAIIVQLAPPTITSVSVTCDPATVIINATSQCTATVQGTASYSSAVTWSANGGTIGPTGLFTAPASAGTVMVTATSTQDPTKSGEVAVIVQAQIPASKHVVLVMEENQSYSTVVGKTSVWPNLNNLINIGALPTNYYADSHPSIGNYFMLTTGQLLTTNDNSTTVWNVDNIARRMLASGVPFRIYAEGITQGYLGGNTGLYLIRHNPFAMLSDIADSTQVANQTIWPFSQFAVDLANGTLPEFSYIVPDVNDDAHNGTPQQADTWLQTNVITPLSNYSAFEPGGDGVLIVDFDEAATSDTTYGGGHVSPVLWGPNVKVGYTQTSSTVYQHQSMLATMMEALQLSNPPGTAATAPPMAEFFVEP